MTDTVAGPGACCGYRITHHPKEQAMSDKDIKPTSQDEPVDEAKAETAGEDRKAERKTQAGRYGG